jgi:hypothetical protein
MKLFLAEHTWDAENTVTIIKAAQPLFSGENLPKNLKLHATYLYGQIPKAICIWETDNLATLTAVFESMKDVLPMENKFTQITRMYPTVDVGPRA